MSDAKLLAPAPAITRPPGGVFGHWKLGVAALVVVALLGYFRPAGDARRRAYDAMHRPGVSLTMTGDDLDRAEFKLVPGLEEGSQGNLAWAFQQLGRFPEVKHVETHYLMTVSIPVLGRLRDLESLAVTETMDVDDAEFAFLRNARKLESLSLRGDKITPAVVGHLAGLSKLKTLTLAGPKMVGSFEGVGGIPNLETVAIEGGRFKKNASVSLGPAPKLRALRLSNVDAGAGLFASPGDFAALETLELWHVHVDREFFQRLAKLPRLRELKIRTSEGGFDDLMEDVARLPTLESMSFMSLSDNADRSLLTARGMEKLAASKSLRELRIAYAPIGDAGVEALAKMPLTRLALFGVGMSERSFPKLLQMQSLKGLLLSESRWRVWGSTRVSPAIAEFAEEFKKRNNIEVEMGGWSLAW